MNEKKRIRIILIIAMITIAVLVQFNLMFNILPLNESKNQIIVNSDSKCNGTVQIFTYSNLKHNVNGTYNESEFYTSNSSFLKRYHGNVFDIPIVNGKATYNLPENIQFFIVNPYGDTDEIFDGSDQEKINIKFYSNGHLIVQSNSVIYGNIFKIDFGGKIYDLNGDILNETELAK